MAKQFLLVIGFLFSIHVMSQTGIGTSTPHVSAKLEVSATNKGFLPPRVALTGVYDVSTIPTPATGLLVFCTGTGGLASGYYFFNGTSWATIATEGGSGSIAAEFGAQFLSSNVSITSGTPVDVISFTLPSAGTWEVITFLRAQGAAGYASEFAIYDASNNLVPNSEILPAYGEIASTGTGVVRITTNGSAVCKVKAWASSGAFNVTSDFNGRTGVTWKKISGNAPVTGQSVDYVSVSSISQSSIGDNRDLIFTSNNGGNIPYNTSTGVFTLSANKTYLFQAQVRTNGASADGNYIEYGFVDATSNTLLVNGTQTITSSTTRTAGFGSNPVINFIYTPTSNQTVKLRTTATTVGTQNITSGTANITQIGSSAIINPWTLSGTNTFNTTGNVGIGTTTPTEKLEVSGNVKATEFIGTASSAKLFLLEAYSNAIYSMPGSYSNDICRYNIVNNTINVPSSWFNTTTYRFTPQKVGYWEIRASYDIFRNGETYLMINRNNVNLGQVGSLSEVQLIVSKILYLNGSTDFITIANSGFNASATRTQGIAVSWFQARWVGE